jgi:hypothetical protein
MGIVPVLYPRGDPAQHTLRYEVRPKGTPRTTITAIAIIVRITNQLTSSYLRHLYKTRQCLTSNIRLCVPDTSDNCQCGPDNIRQCVSCTLTSYALRPFHPHVRFSSVIPPLQGVLGAIADVSEMSSRVSSWTSPRKGRLPSNKRSQ